MTDRYFQIEMDSSELMLIALRFNERINQQDPDGLAELMTDDHMFIDNGGNVTKGKNAMKEGWREFFKKYPDYRNKFTGVTVQDNVVVIVGYSTCSFKQLDGPNLWTAKIRGGRVSEWRVFWLNER
ncbi:MAG TPA: nuclear transport factor 2 family protein [Candidatus Acidoferrum sp.]|nr:nuclear transport factor 2 family protein [Candidatus Acidoferrum sp.]